MIVDPMAQATGAFDVFAAAKTSVAPIPSVIPVPAVTYEEAGDAGKRTLWVVFAVMLISAVIFTILAWSVPVTKRLYHIITTLIVVFAALSYFAMATGHGVAYHTSTVKVHHKAGIPATEEVVHRQVFYARYIDWTITTPLLLLDLSLIAGLSGADIFVAIVADVIMILTGLFAAFGSENTPQKWGWYTIACIAYLVVIFQLIFNGRKTASAKGGKVANFFAAIGGFTLIIWTIYPIIWGVADGSRKLGVDEEIIAYAVLDILAKPVFGAWLLFTHKAIPETNIDIGGFWSHGLSSEGAIRVGDDDEGA